jgi:AcrR family transcriptional regulator
MSGDRVRGEQDRATRGARILDVTAELLLRFGYRRITIEDIAEHAGIGKGTVYLHWKTREELFGAVFEREVLHALDELLRTLRHEPEAWRPHRLARSYFLAIMHRPLLAACFLGDAEVLGKLAKPGSSARENRHRLVSHDYFQLLADHGLLRDDLSVDAVSYGFMATLEGFIQAETAGAADLKGRGELLALIIRRAFETGRAVSAADEKAIAAEVVGLFTSLGAADRADLGIGENQ